MNMDVSAALDVAIRAHAGQVDKAGRPYIMHIVRVMAGVPVDDEDAQIVAALHLVAQMSDWTIGELRLWFAPHICDAIDAVAVREDEGLTEFFTRCNGNDLANTVIQSIGHDHIMLMGAESEPINDVMTA